MDLSKVQNPYDFAHPVSTAELFAGRAKELDEIRYYLDQAARVDRPINLALMGERASGKTSLLNMIEIEAQRRGLYVVRVNLDESDAEHQLPFFSKLIDCILYRICSEGAYGGLTGKTYDTFRDMMDAYEIPDDKLHCPFSFPIQFAKAMSKGNSGASVSDIAFQQDIQSIQREIGKTLVILFDECDVLTSNRVILQKLRNINMSTTRVMLVFTGTPALFPLIDDVFSPIIRQFKKIQIGPFTKEDETEDCIRKPLEKVGIDQPEEIFDEETYFDVTEIHDLSGGRPYEIQLLCHFLFRRIQEGRAKRMLLTLDVLDEVRRELETTQDVTSRPVLTAIRRFDKQQLNALGVLARCNRHASLDQLWFLEHILFADERWTRDALEKNLKMFEDAHIITVDDGVIRFVGDDFDRIYCKYFARTHSVRLSINDMPYELALGLMLDAYLLDQPLGLKPLFFMGLDDSVPLLIQLQELTANITKGSGSNPFDVDSFAAERLYALNLDYRHDESIQLYSLTFRAPQADVTNVYYFDSDGDVTMPSIDDVRAAVTEIADRATNLGGSLEVTVVNLPIVPGEDLFAMVQRADNSKLKSAVSEMHETEMTMQYLDAGDLDEALYHGKKAYSLSQTQRIGTNLGYLYLIDEQLDAAREILHEAIKGEDPYLRSVAAYNLAIIEAKEGNFPESRSYLLTCIQEVEGLERENQLCACLIVPHMAFEEGVMSFDEVRDPYIGETGQAALALVTAIIDGKEA